jgi:hypothetical protein
VYSRRAAHCHVAGCAQELDAANGHRYCFRCASPGAPRARTAALLRALSAAGTFKGRSILALRWPLAHANE